jgi:hypothetical protein
VAVVPGCPQDTGNDPFDFRGRIDASDVDEARADVAVDTTDAASDTSDDIEEACPSGDASLDTDRDGLTDCEERQCGQCLEVDDPDSDGDGRSDGDELADGTDPCEKDNSGTEGDWHQGFCDDYLADASTDRIETYSDQSADWKLALHPDVQFQKLKFNKSTDTSKTAAVFSMPDTNAAGFIVSMPVGPDQDWRRLATEPQPDYHNRSAANFDVLETSTSADGYTTIRLGPGTHSESGCCTSVTQHRNSLVRNLLGSTASAVETWPGDQPGNRPAWAHWLSFAEFRPDGSGASGQGTLFVVGSLSRTSPAPSIESDRRWIEWHTPSVLAEAGATLQPACRMYDAHQAPNLNFHWIVGNQLSTSFRNQVRDIATHTFSLFDDNWWDVSWSVIPMWEADSVTSLKERWRWTTFREPFVQNLETVMTESDTAPLRPFQTMTHTFDAVTMSRHSDASLTLWNFASDFIPDRRLSRRTRNLTSSLGKATTALVPEGGCQPGSKPDEELYHAKLGSADSTDRLVDVCTADPADVANRYDQLEGSEFLDRDGYALPALTSAASLRAHTRQHNQGVARQRWDSTEDSSLSVTYPDGRAVFRGQARPDHPADDGIERVGFTYYTWAE